MNTDELNYCHYSDLPSPLAYMQLEDQDNEALKILNDKDKREEKLIQADLNHNKQNV